MLQTHASVDAVVEALPNTLAPTDSLPSLLDINYLLEFLKSHNTQANQQAHEAIRTVLDELRNMPAALQFIKSSTHAQALTETAAFELAEVITTTIRSVIRESGAGFMISMDDYLDLSQTPKLKTYYKDRHPYDVDIHKLALECLTRTLRGLMIPAAKQVLFRLMVTPSTHSNDISLPHAVMQLSSSCYQSIYAGDRNSGRIAEFEQTFWQYFAAYLDLDNPSYIFNYSALESLKSQIENTSDRKQGVLIYVYRLLRKLTAQILNAAATYPKPQEN